MAKRAYCLYWVSTKGQVEKDDIPMQKQRCREFAAEKGWSIVREFSEKGVSGFKVSAKDRDAIQEIQQRFADYERKCAQRWTHLRLHRLPGPRSQRPGVHLQML